ncbi:MAG: murein L,D-transpeptidase [Hellea sp.]|nr:murein L,D-transpeptidase [Hyphomonadaceae bacterium]NNE57707.1 murein L,D-transpeptidase [Hellea sp.]
MLKTFISLLLWAILFGVACAQEVSPQNSSDRAVNSIDYQTRLSSNQLDDSGFSAGSPVFIRIVKTVDGSLRDGYLELFLENQDGAYGLYKSWPICTFSGDLGPKLKEGDGQSPEGFYFVRPGQMNPNSSYHLSFNLGYPNAYDRAYGRTGSFLMVHGDCVSIGCYAMTDPVIEEIYSVMTDAFDNGQPFIRVHAFPFPMTTGNLEKYQQDPNIDYWRNLKEGWDWFETSGQPPNVTVSEKKYQFSAPD